MKVGKYVRTKRGLIAKIVNINTFREPCMKYGIEASYLDDIWFIGDDDIKLVKDKPIDLIEKGDVLSFKDGSVCRVMEATDNGYYLLKDYGGEQYYESKEWIGELTSIVTKEQFESMEYKVGE